MEDARQASRHADAGRGRRHPRVVALLGGILLLVVGMLIGGFLVFAAAIPRSEIALQRSADGIVVLDRRGSRIEDALACSSPSADNGFSSPACIRTPTRPRSPGEARRWSACFTCCIDLDREAQNTIGNAVAAARWARARNFRSLIVVTSAWHMPRAFLELARAKCRAWRSSPTPSSASACVRRAGGRGPKPRGSCSSNT